MKLWKTCIICSKIYSRPPGLTTTKWEKRKTCGEKSCAGECIRRTKRARGVEKLKKYCLECEGRLIQHKNESVPQFNERQFCGVECTNESQRHLRVTINCDVCDKIMSRKPSALTWQNVFCGNKCRTVGMKGVGKSRQPRTCQYCKEVFTPEAFHYKKDWKKYCSPDCHTKSKTSRTVLWICLACGNEKTLGLNNADRRTYCDFDCRSRGPSIDVITKLNLRLSPWQKRRLEKKQFQKMKQKILYIQKLLNEKLSRPFKEA